MRTVSGLGPSRRSTTAVRGRTGVPSRASTTSACIGTRDPVMPRGPGAAAWRDLQEATERILPFYDRVNFANTFGRIPFWRDRLARPASAADVVLELGSGPGSFARLLGARAVYCLEPSIMMARGARKRLPGGRFGPSRGAAAALPFRTASVDRVYCSFSFRQFFDKLAAIHA